MVLCVLSVHIDNIFHYHLSVILSQTPSFMTSWLVGWPAADAMPLAGLHLIFGLHSSDHMSSVSAHQLLPVVHLWNECDVMWSLHVQCRYILMCRAAYLKVSGPTAAFGIWIRFYGFEKCKYFLTEHLGMRSSTRTLWCQMLDINEIVECCVTVC